jgi:hypothetical protein
VQQGRLLAALCCIVRKSHRGSGASERVSECGSERGRRGLCLPRGLQGEARVAVRENSGAVRIDDCARSLHLPSTHTHTHTQHEVRGAGRVTASLRHCVTASLTHSLTCCVVSERMSSVASSCACCCTSLALVALALVALALVSLALVAVLVLVAVAVSEVVRRRAKVGGGHSLQHTSNTGSALTHSLTHPHITTLTHPHITTVTHTLTHSLTHSLTHTLTHSHTHSHTHTLTLLHTHTLIHSLLLTHPHITTLTHSLTHSLGLPAGDEVELHHAARGQLPSGSHSFTHSLSLFLYFWDMRGRRPEQS